MATRNAQSQTTDPQVQKQLREEELGKLVMAARHSLRRGDRLEARKSLTKALKMDNRDCSALELLGEYYMSGGEQEKALEVLRLGHKLYPERASFEENIAFCLIDIEEMKRAKEQSSTLGNADPDQWMDRKPLVAVFFSILPGAGQVYNEENTSAAIIFGIWALAFIAWYFPLMNAFKNIPRDIEHTFQAALAQMSQAGRLGFWLMLAIWVGAYIYAVVDAATGALRANERRRTEDFNF